MALVVRRLQQQRIQVDLQLHRKDSLVTHNVLGLVESNVLVEREEKDHEAFRDESRIPEVLSLRQL